MEDKREEFLGLVIPLMKWISENYNPHAKIVIDSGSAELLTGELCFNTEDFWRD